MYILSAIRSKGNYQGNDYDNINFQCFSDVQPKGLLCGQAFEVVKVKTDIVIDCFGKSISSIDWAKIEGSALLPTYNKFGQVTAICISAPEGDVTMETTTDGPVPPENLEAAEDGKDKKPKGK